MSPEPAWCPRNLRESSNTELLRRYVYGPGSDEPILWYEGAGTSDKRYLHADERGSIIALSNASGTVTQVNAYDEFGIPQAKLPSGAPGSTATTSFGRFGYTGQAWFPEIGLYHYKARTYSPTLGRFLQSDPIGYGDGLNFYNYVGGDPVNNTDPSGLLNTPTKFPRSDPPRVTGGWRITITTTYSTGRVTVTTFTIPGITSVGGSRGSSTPLSGSLSGGGGGSDGGGRAEGDAASGDENTPIVVTASVSRSLVDTYFFFNQGKKANLYKNLRALLGDRFNDSQISGILSDILAQRATTVADLVAFSNVTPGVNNTVSLSKSQKTIIDRFIQGLPRNGLNIDAINYFNGGISSGRIRIGS